MSEVFSSLFERNPLKGSDGGIFRSSRNGIRWPVSNSFNLNIINRFGDSLHQQSVNQQKVAELVAKLTPEMNLKLAGQQVQLSVANKQQNELILPLSRMSPKQAKQIQAQWQFHPHALKLIPQQVKNTVELINKAPVQQILLKNSLSETFNQALKSQAVEPKSTLIAPSSSSNSPISSWLKDSFADLKTRISDAVRYFEKLPATTKAAVNQSTHQLIESKNTISQLGFNANKINIVKFAAIQQSAPQHAVPQVSQKTSGPVSANTPLPATKQTEPLTESQSTRQVSLPVSYNKAPPLIQLLQRIKVSLEPLVSAQNQATQLATNHSKEQLPVLSLDNAMQKAPADNKSINSSVNTLNSDKATSEQLAPVKSSLANSVLKNMSEQTKQHNFVTRAPNEQTVGLQKVVQQQTQLHVPFLATKEPNLSQPLLPIRPIEAALIAKLLPLPESKRRPVSITVLCLALLTGYIAYSTQDWKMSMAFMVLTYLSYWAVRALVCSNYYVIPTSPIDEITIDDKELYLPAMLFTDKKPRTVNKQDIISIDSIWNYNLKANDELIGSTMKRSHLISVAFNTSKGNTIEIPHWSVDSEGLVFSLLKHHYTVSLNKTTKMVYPFKVHVSVFLLLFISMLIFESLW